ncbi:copper-binding protein [Hydrogenophaga pseudoflava]|uniref:copper-binding protein n=1 Tax=Hydrogenophaga pseudoflava TaxID=47421 RepID=UPI0027E59BFF|nr:copper-binding protein [Hydrogenophaga pseudoflava]MDQ7742866.1 copper-binding protein [Hydrogenophaga pseudoflava]
MNHLLRTLIASTSLIATLAIAADPPPFVDAEVRKVDTTAGKVTLKHSDIPNLDMPPMTMVFQVKDPATLTPLKAGDQVRFRAEKVNGAYVATDIEPRR